jgi:carboxylate-amine ligase
LADWDAFQKYYEFLRDCGIVASIKDLYWDIRPKPEYGTVEIRVCDTPLSIVQASALAALAQCLARKLLRERPAFLPGPALQVARYNKFQACRYGFDAQVSCPEQRRQEGLKESLAKLLEALGDDASELGCQRWLDVLRRSLFSGVSDADWLRSRLAAHENLNDVVRDSVDRFRELRHPAS